MTRPAQPKNAACQCGALTATVSAKAEAMSVACHCLSCQQRTGSPFTAMAYYTKHEVTLAGDSTQFSRDTDAENQFTSGFCPAFGSTVWAIASKYPDKIGIPIGAFSDPLFGAPDRSVF